MEADADSDPMDDTIADGSEAIDEIEFIADDSITDEDMIEDSIDELIADEDMIEEDMADDAIADDSRPEDALEYISIEEAKELLAEEFRPEAEIFAETELLTFAEDIAELALEFFIELIEADGATLFGIDFEA